jgi:NRPS condensation-like uncharacterized protein
MLNAHHAVTDGVGALRFLHSAARAYSGRPDPRPGVDPLLARDPKTCFGATATGRRAKVKSPSTPNGTRAFLAPVGARAGPGFGFVHLTIPAEKAIRLDPRRFEPSASLNDLLQAALHRAIAAWNAHWGYPCDCIAVYMPANSRPPDWRDEFVINHTVGAKIKSAPAERANAPALMAAITRQTRWIKSGCAAAAVYDLPGWVLNLTPLLLPTISWLLGDRVENTAVLSNLGRLDQVPAFGAAAGPVKALAFSPPCGMPMGLSLGVAGVEGGLHLCFRYRRALFGHGPARRFAELFVECLLSLGEVEPGWPGPELVVARSPTGPSPNAAPHIREVFASCKEHPPCVSRSG